MSSFVFGQKENERRRKKYEEEMSAYGDAQSDANTGAAVMGGIGAAAAPIPIAGPIIAALTAIGAPLVSRYGAGDEPKSPNYVKEREFEVEDHQRRSGGMALQDPATMTQGYLGQEQGPQQDFRIAALQGLRDKRRQRNMGGFQR
jgi:hypothetical protein